MNKFLCLIGLAITSSLLVFALPLYSKYIIYPHFIDIVTFEKEVSAKQIANHITKMMKVDNVTHSITRESITDHFTKTLLEAQLDFDLTKIKVFSSKGEIVYSSDDREIGVFNTNPYFVDIVAQGTIFSTVVSRDEKTMEDETVTRDVIETYVPLMRDKHFIGALEIYYDISYTEHSISEFVEKSFTITMLIMLFLLLCILSLAFSAITHLKKQLKAERHLQLLKDKLPPLYNVSPEETDD